MPSSEYINNSPTTEPKDTQYFSLAYKEFK